MPHFSVIMPQTLNVNIVIKYKNIKYSYCLRSNTLLVDNIILVILPMPHFSNGMEKRSKLDILLLFIVFVDLNPLTVDLSSVASNILKVIK